jgi:phytoene synthase
LSKAIFRKLSTAWKWIWKKSVTKVSRNSDFTATASLPWSACYRSRYANDLGVAFQLTNILRDVREDADRGRIYIPAAEMQEFGVSTEMLTKPHTTPSLRNLFEFQAQRARQYYRSAMDTLPDTDRYAQRAGMIMAAIYEKLLDEIEADGYRVLEHRIGITPIRKLWIAWRTARQERKYAK